MNSLWEVTQVNCKVSSFILSLRRLLHRFRLCVLIPNLSMGWSLTFSSAWGLGTKNHLLWCVMSTFECATNVTGRSLCFIKHKKQLPSLCRRVEMVFTENRGLHGFTGTVVAQWQQHQDTLNPRWFREMAETSVQTVAPFLRNRNKSVRTCILSVDVWFDNCILSTTFRLIWKWQSKVLWHSYFKKLLVKRFVHATSFAGT